MSVWLYRSFGVITGGINGGNPPPLDSDPFSPLLVLRFQGEVGDLAVPGNEGISEGAIPVQDIFKPLLTDAQTLNYTTSARMGANRRISVGYTAGLSPGGDTTANDDPWCAEMFFYCDNLSASVDANNNVLMTDRRVIAGNARGWYWYFTDAGNLIFQAWDVNQVEVVNLTANAAIAQGVWYHVAVQRDGARNWVMYVNGVSVATDTQGPAENIANDLQRLDICGWKETSNRFFSGYLDSVRITRDLRYTGSFTPNQFFPVYATPGIVGAAPTGNEVAARAWRIYPMYSTGQNLQLSELVFRHEVGGADDVVDHGGIRYFQQNTTPGYNAFHAYDNNGLTDWAGIGAWRQWIGFDLGPSFSTVVREITIELSNSFPAQRHLAFLLEYSLDGIEWKPYFLHPNKITSPGTNLAQTDHTITVTPNIPAKTAPGTPRRYTELLCWGHGENELVAGADRLRLLDVDGNDLFTLYGGTPTAAGNNGGSLVPASAFDDTANAWRDNISEGEVTWLRLDHGAGTPRAPYGFFVEPEYAFNLSISETIIRTSDDLTNWQYLHIDNDRNPYEAFGAWFDNAAPVTPPTYQSVSTSASAIATFPGTVNLNDLLILFVGSGVGGGSSAPGAPWRRIGRFLDVGNAQVEAFWKIADGTETGTFDVNPTAGADNNYTTSIVRITGADNRWPIMSFNNIGSNTNGTARELPYVKVTADGQMILTCLIGGWSASTPYTATFPVGMTEVAEFQSTTIGSGGCLMAVAYNNNVKAGQQTYDYDDATFDTALTYAAVSLVIHGAA